MNRISSALVIGSLLLFSSCQNSPKKTVTVQASLPETVKKEIKKQQFIPSADSSITLQQLKCWSSCNSMLDSLSIMYADSFKTASAQERMRFQDAYTSAQDKICVIKGLAGGYKEYKWVMETMSNPKNRVAVESAKMSVF